MGLVGTKYLMGWVGWVFLFNGMDGMGQKFYFRFNGMDGMGFFIFWNGMDGIKIIRST
jgi:hypothetical protein